MQTTTSSQTDLLSGILNIQVRNEDKITEQDRIYCQNQQDELYKTLDQIDSWYKIFKAEADKYEGSIKFKYEENGSNTVRSYHDYYNKEKEDYIHPRKIMVDNIGVVNRFKLCIFERLNTTHYHL